MEEHNKSIRDVTSVLFIGNWQVGVAWAAKKKEFLITEIEKMAGFRWGD